jgi:hypothetical protein
VVQRKPHLATGEANSYDTEVVGLSEKALLDCRGRGHLERGSFFPSMSCRWVGLRQSVNRLKETRNAGIIDDDVKRGFFSVEVEE